MPRFFFRAAFIALLFAGSASFVTEDARGSVSAAVVFEALVRDTTSVGVATPIEQHAVWEGPRIVTYTRVHIESAVAGELKANADTWVVTLGGIVGDVGQAVDGEAVLSIGVPSLLFLRPDSGNAGVHIVTARAQGQFPITLGADKKSRLFTKSNSVGMILRHPSTAAQRLASEVIEGREIDEVTREVATTWKRLHAN
jgi:hypothetical protein